MDYWGYVKSLMFVLDYLGDMECIWRICVFKEFRVSFVFLVLINFDLNCIDFLEVRDGLDVISLLLNCYCGFIKVLVIIFLSGRVMFVWFKFDSYFCVFDGVILGFCVLYFVICVKLGMLRCYLELNFFIWKVDCNISSNGCCYGEMLFLLLVKYC